MPLIPFAARWSIPENQLIPLKDSVNKWLVSASVTNIPSFDYYLSIYPNESVDENHGRTWIGLFLELGKVKNVEADYTILIESANYSFEDQHIYENTNFCGGEVCETEDFFKPEKKYIVDGKCIIKVHGAFEFENDEDTTSETAAAEQQKWDGADLGNDLWKEDDDKNFTIVVDEKEIKVHKLLLRTRSDVFRAMFNPETKESIENKVEIIDFTFDVVETAVKMIYNCNFTSFLSLDQIMSLLQFFDKYNIPSLKDKVESFLINQISPTTVCRLTNCSVFTNSIQLKKKCMEFMEKSIAPKIPLSDIEILDNDVLVKAVQNSFYKDVETE